MNLQIRTRDNMTKALTDLSIEQAIKREGGALDLDIIERSFTPGAVFNGERRFASNTLNISLTITKDTDAAFRELVNDALYYASAAEYIEDTDNELRTRVEFINYKTNPSNTKGTVNRYETIDLSFKRLDSFWEDTVEQTQSSSGSDFTMTINNSGYYDTPPVFEIATTSLCELIQIFITDPVRGIEIQDLVFGNNTELDDYIINNVTGEALLGDDLLNRNDRIRGGSGFFDFPVGSFTLNLIFAVSVSVTVKWRRRFFI